MRKKILVSELAVLLVVMSTFAVKAEEIRLPSKMEGTGFVTSEEAVAAYIEAFQENDIDKMISTFAIESFVDNFDMEKYIEWFTCATPSIRYIPVLSGFSRDLNIETRRTSITQTIFYHYANLIQCDLYSGDTAGHTIPYKSEETDISDFVDEIYIKDDTSVLTTIEFDYEFADLDELTSGKYSNENNIKNRQRRADAYGAAEMDSAAAYLTVNGEEYLLCMGTVRYGDEWYIFEGSGTIGAILGLSQMSGGLIQVDEL